MLYWALVFFMVAIIAAIFGFGGIASAAAGIAQILFFVFLVVFVVSLIMGLASRRIGYTLVGFGLLGLATGEPATATDLSKKSAKAQ